MKRKVAILRAQGKLSEAIAAAHSLAKVLQADVELVRARAAVSTHTHASGAVTVTAARFGAVEGAGQHVRTERRHGERRVLHGGGGAGHASGVHGAPAARRGVCTMPATLASRSHVRCCCAQLLYAVGDMASLRTARQHFAQALELQPLQNLRALLGLTMVRWLAADSHRCAADARPRDGACRAAMLWRAARAGAKARMARRTGNFTSWRPARRWRSTSACHALHRAPRGVAGSCCVVRREKHAPEELLSMGASAPPPLSAVVPYALRCRAAVKRLVTEQDGSFARGKGGEAEGGK